MIGRGGRGMLAAALASAALACGGGGGGGGTGPTVPPTPTPAPSIGFTPSGTGGVNSFALTRVSSDATTLVLSLEVTSVTDLYGIAFDLEFPSTALAFASATEGDFLDPNGSTDTSLQVADTGSGTLVVGLSRLGAVPGRTGTGSLLRLHFTRQAAGSGSLTFKGPMAFDSQGAVIASTVWSGGTVQVP